MHGINVHEDTFSPFVLALANHVCMWEHQTDEISFSMAC